MDNIHKRIVWIDNLRGLAMCMVVLSHSRVAPCVIASLCWCCHVPLFFIISGIMLGINENDKLEFVDFFKSKAKGIIYPYVTLSIIELIVECFTNRAGIINSIILFFSLDGIGALWFLPTLFIASVLWYFIKQFKNVLWFTIFLAGIAAIMTLYFVPNAPYAYVYIITRSIYATIFMLMGNVIYDHLGIVQKYRGGVRY